jgi:hypothetical protein
MDTDFYTYESFDIFDELDELLNMNKSDKFSYTPPSSPNPDVFLSRFSNQIPRYYKGYILTSSLTDTSVYIKPTNTYIKQIWENAYIPYSYY